MDDDSDELSVVCIDSESEEVTHPIVPDWGAELDSIAPPGTVFEDFPEEIPPAARSIGGHVFTYQHWFCVTLDVGGVF